MTYFVCLAAPQQVFSKLSVTFSRFVYFTNVTETPFGKAACGENREWVAYILQVGSSSASLMNKGAKKKSLRDIDYPELFVSFVGTLLEAGCPSVVFLIHVMSGLIKTEEVRVQEEKVIKLVDLAHSLPSLQEDVRYTVTK